MGDFVAMGGYGAYVWSAFAFTIAVMVALLWQSWRLARKRQAELDTLRRELRHTPRAPARPLVARRPGDPAPDRPGAASQAAR